MYCNCGPVHDSVLVEADDGLEELPGVAADEGLLEAGLRVGDQLLQRPLRTVLHEDQHLLTVHLQLAVIMCQKFSDVWTYKSARG